MLDKSDPYTPEHIGVSMMIAFGLMLVVTACVMVFMTCKISINAL